MSTRRPKHWADEYRKAKPGTVEWMSVSLYSLMVRHISASGPVTFRELRTYLRDQFPAPLDDYEVAEVLTRLIREGSVRVYDTGDAFDWDGEQ